MIVVIEGPDNSGKTTLAVRLASMSGAVYLKSQRPSELKELQLAKFNHLLQSAERYNGVAITDRHPAISELIYGKVLRGGHSLSPDSIENSLSYVDAIIFCRPHSEKLLSTLRERAHLDGVIDNASQLIEAYDAWAWRYFEHLRHSPPEFGFQRPGLFVYDYVSEETPEQLWARVKKGVQS